MNSQNCVIGISTDHEPRRDDSAVIAALTVDMFDVGNRLDDFFQRLSDLLDRISRSQPGRLDQNVHHRH